MRIQESTVQLAATHEAERSQTLETTTVQDFRQLFKSLAAENREDEVAARERVQKLLQQLVDAILAAIDGKKCKENLAARRLCRSMPNCRRGRGKSAGSAR